MSEAQFLNEFVRSTTHGITHGTAKRHLVSISSISFQSDVAEHIPLNAGLDKLIHTDELEIRLELGVDI